MVLAPRLALHADVVCGTFTPERLLQDLVALEAIQRLAKRGREKGDLPAL